MKKQENVFVTKSYEETQAAGSEFIKKSLASQGKALQGQRLDKALVIALFGELGSGKTTFVQGLARGLGITKRIISPTFVIVRQYVILGRKATPESFYHIDLYRTESENDLAGLGIEEILQDPKNIVVIEWAEKLGSLLPKSRIDINFTYVSDIKRKIVIYEHKN